MRPPVNSAPTIRIANANPVFRRMLSGTRIPADPVNGSGRAVGRDRAVCRATPSRLGKEAALPCLAAGDRQYGRSEAEGAQITFSCCWAWNIWTPGSRLLRRRG